MRVEGFHKKTGQWVTIGKIPDEHQEELLEGLLSIDRFENGLLGAEGVNFVFQVRDFSVIRVMGDASE